MSGAGADPWADPDAAVTGEAYLGPPGYLAPAPGGPAPGYGAPGYGPPGYGPPGYGPPGYGPPGYGWAPAGYGYPGPWAGPPLPTGPRRPGSVVAAAVLALVQAGIVAFVSAYLLLVASLFGLASLEGGGGRAADIGQEIRVLAWIQLVSAVLLVAAGTLALNGRDRRVWFGLQLAAFVEVALALYWAVRIVGIFDDLAGPGGGAGVLVFGAVLFGLGPAVAIALMLTRPARWWFGVARG